MEKNTIRHIDCSIGLLEIPDNSVDCCVTDPPYGIFFMGRSWDYQIPAIAVWQQVLRVLKPGAHLLGACGTRTQHRMAVNVEDAGFEIRDVICWHYGQGFPKSLDISKAIDMAAGAERMTSGQVKRPGKPAGRYGAFPGNNRITMPATVAAKQWEGWGTGLKPATEFWTLARKPISEKTVAENLIRYGTGGLHIDACRVGQDDGTGAHQMSVGTKTVTGRFPANVILDEFMAAQMDQQTGELTSGKPSGFRKAKNNVFGQYAPGQEVTGYGDSGGGSRFFYVAKADAAERGPGNNHPTVKPLSLMHYLIKLICPVEPGRIVLDPFAGTGTTCIAARQLGLDFIAFEQVEEHARIAENRLRANLGLFY